MELSNCKCSKEGRNLVVCIDGTSNQFGEKNTNVVELYSKIVKTEDLGQKPTQLTYYNSGIGTYAKPSWISVKYLMQVVDNAVDLAIAWNFEKIIIGAYRWLSDNYKENDRIFLFGFSRGAYQVRALAGMIQRVGLIHMGNEEQIPFAYELYATHTEALANRFKTTFSRENVKVHFVGVWDTVSSVGIIRGKSLPLTDSADHVCFFRHALALDERRVKFLPEYVHGGVCERSTVSENPKAQIEKTGSNPSPHIKEVWFPGTHSDIGGGNQLNHDLDLGKTPFLWMSFEAVSSGLRLRPTRVEWHWGHLQDKKESLTGVWHIFEWIPVKTLSYQDESSTVYSFNNGRGRQIKPGQKVHSSIAFCDKSYHPKAISPEQRCLCELVGKGSLSNREWINGWEDLIEMDIFDLSLIPTVIERLKLERGSETSIWAHRFKAMTSTDECLAALRGRPNIINDLVQIFTRADQPPEVQERVIAILEMSSKGSGSVLLSLENSLWLLRIARENSNINHRNFAIKFLAYSLSEEQSCTDIVDENLLSTLDKMTRDEQYHWVVDGAFAMLRTILSQTTLPQKMFAAITVAIVRKRIAAEDSRSQAVAKRLLGAILRNAENRQRLLDNDILHSLLTKIGNWDDTERLLFSLFLVNLYEYLPNEFFTLFTSKLCDEMNDPQVGHSRHNILLVLRDTIHSDDLRKRIWNKKTVKALRSAFNQGCSSERSLVIELYRKGIIYESLKDTLFDTDTVRDLGHALHDGNEDIRSNTVDFFIAAMALESIRDKIFDNETVSTLGGGVSDERSYIAISVAKFLTAAIAQEGVRDKIFDTETVAALGCALRHKDSNVRSGAVKIFTAAIAQDGLWDKIFVTGTIAALGHALRDRDSNIRTGMVKFFTTAIAQESLWDKIFDTEIVSALGHALGDKNMNIRASTINFFTAALAQDGVRAKIFEAETVAALGRAIVGIRDSAIGISIVKFFTAAIAQESFRDKIFDAGIIAALKCALDDKGFLVRNSVVTVFAAAIPQEGFRDKIFDHEAVAALGRALANTSSVGAVKFFITAIAQEGFRDKIFDNETVAALGRALACDSSVFGAVKFFITAIAQEGFRDKIFDTETVAALRHALADKAVVVRTEVIKFYIAAIAQEGFRDRIFDTKTVAALRHALTDQSSVVRTKVVKFFITAIAQEGFRDKIFDTMTAAAFESALAYNTSVVGAVKFFITAIAQEGCRDKIFVTRTVAALRGALVHKSCVSRSKTVIRKAVKIFIAAIAQGATLFSRDIPTEMFAEGFRDKIFDTETAIALRRALAYKTSVFRSEVRGEAVKFFIAAIAQEGFRDKIFDTKTVAALQHALADQSSIVRTKVVKFLIAAIAQEGFRDMIFDTKTVAALVCALADEDSNVRAEVVVFFIAAVAQEGFRDKIFDTETVAALRRSLLVAYKASVRSEAVKFFIAAIAQEGFRDKIFDTKTIVALGRALADKASVVRTEAVKFFNASLAQEGFRDKIFDTETVAALGRALADIASVVRTEAVKFFIAAIAQEGIRDKIFDTDTVLALNRSQDDENSDIHKQNPFLDHATIDYFELLWAVLYALK